MSQIRCPRCRKVMAERRADGLYIQHEGRGYELPPGTTITRIYCERCKRWLDVPEDAGINVVGAAGEAVGAK